MAEGVTCYTCGRAAGDRHRVKCPRRAWGLIVLEPQARFDWRPTQEQEAERIAANMEERRLRETGERMAETVTKWSTFISDVDPIVSGQMKCVYWDMSEAAGAADARPSVGDLMHVRSYGEGNPDVWTRVTHVLALDSSRPCLILSVEVDDDRYPDIQTRTRQVVERARREGRLHGAEASVLAIAAGPPAAVEALNLDEETVPRKVAVDLYAAAQEAWGHIDHKQAGAYWVKQLDEAIAAFRLAVS